jgi:hypothetical protein
MMKIMDTTLQDIMEAVTSKIDVYLPLVGLSVYRRNHIPRHCPLRVLATERAVPWSREQVMETSALRLR